VFTRQLATMMKAGVPLVQSFDIVTDGLENPSMKELVTTIKNDVAAGSGLALSLAKYPRHFDQLFCSLVGAGESAGTLEVMLDRVATYKEKTEQLKAKIKKALTYPTAVIVVALVVTGILLVKVVPAVCGDLPELRCGPAGVHPVRARPVGFHAEMVVHHPRRSLVGSFYAFREARLRSVSFAEGIDKFMLKAPIFGNIVHDAVVARFSRTLATTFNAGVPLVDALESTAGASGNAVYAKAIMRIRDDVTTGSTLYSSDQGDGPVPEHAAADGLHRRGIGAARRDARQGRQPLRGGRRQRR
jgi:type IV pilus assembly protein PilC